MSLMLWAGRRRWLCEAIACWNHLGTSDEFLNAKDAKCFNITKLCIYYIRYFIYFIYFSNLLIYLKIKICIFGNRPGPGRHVRECGVHSEEAHAHLIFVQRNPGASCVPLFTVHCSANKLAKLSFALPMFPCYRFFTFCIVLPVVTCFLPSLQLLFWCVASKAWQQADSHCPSPPSPSLKVPGWCTRHGLGNKVFSQLRPEKQQKSGSGIRLKGRTCLKLCAIPPMDLWIS